MIAEGALSTDEIHVWPLSEAPVLSSTCRGAGMRATPCFDAEGAPRGVEAEVTNAREDVGARQEPLSRFGESL